MAKYIVSYNITILASGYSRVRVGVKVRASF